MTIDTIKDIVDKQASLSGCSRRKVGAVIVSPELFVISKGYNLDLCQGVCSRTVSGKDLHLCPAIHAEMMAINKCRSFPKGSTLFVSCSPCRKCAEYIAKLGFISEVCYWEAYPDTSGVLYLLEHGIYCQKIG